MSLAHSRGGRVAVVSVGVWITIAGLAGGGDSGAVRRAVAEMLSASRTMVENGDRRDVGRMVAEAERVMAAGERALAELPRPGNRHARDAADHFRQAVDHARQVVEAVHHGQPEEALAHARQTLSQVRRGAGHAEAL